MTLGCKVSKKMLIKNILILIFSAFLTNISLYSQTNDNFVYNKNNLANAYRYYRAKNYSKAAELFEYEIANSPILKIEYFENLANAYMNLKDYTNMLRVSRNGIIVNRFSSKLYFQKGYALYKLGNTNQAIDSIRHSISLKPNDAYMNNYLGLLYLYIEDYKQAESSFLKATVYSPNNIVYMVNLAATYERDKNYSSALEVYESAFKLDPKYKGLQDSITRTRTILGINTNSAPQITNQNNIMDYNEDIEAKPIELENYENSIITNSTITNTFNTNNNIDNTAHTNIIQENSTNMQKNNSTNN